MTDNAAYDVDYATPDPLEVWSAQHFRDKFVNIPGIGKLAEKLGPFGVGDGYMLEASVVCPGYIHLLRGDFCEYLQSVKCLEPGWSIGHDQTCATVIVKIWRDIIESPEVTYGEVAAVAACAVETLIA